MKTKKVLLLATLFLFIIILMAMIPTKLFAAIPDGMKPEFIAILSEDGKFVVTDTSDVCSKESLVWNVLNRHATDSYYFTGTALDEEVSRCQIERRKAGTDNVLESFEIPIIYKEKYSEEFSRILDENNKLLIPFSRLNTSKFELLRDYCASVSNEEINFNATCDENWDGTPCTVEMIRYVRNRSIIEQHIVNVVFEDKFGDDYAKLLDKDGNFVVTSTSHEYYPDYKTNLIDARCRELSNNNFKVIRGETNEDKTLCDIGLYDATTEEDKLIEQHTVKVVYKEEFSDEFKKILNNNGKILITNFSLYGERDSIIQYCDKFDNESINFEVEYVVEDGTACTVAMKKYNNNYFNNSPEKVESHIIEVEYKEVISDDFKQILNVDGDLVIKTSRDYGHKELINNYFYFTQSPNDKFSFWATDINDDATKCVIGMHETDENYHSTLIESHVVDVVYDTKMSDDFKQALNKDGKFVINSTKPNTWEEWYALFYMSYMVPSNYKWEQSYEEEDFSAFDLTIVNSNGIPETHRVETLFEYDEKINSVAAELLKNLPEQKQFMVKDMELINYWLHSGEEERKSGSNFDNYSSELKNYVENKNFNVIIEPGMGMDDDFLTFRAGFALLQYKGVTYGIRNQLDIVGRHILYVPDDTVSTKEALVTALQKRVDEYAGEGKVKISAGEGTIIKYYEDYYNKLKKEFQDKLAAEKAKEKPNQELIYDYEMRIEECDMNKEWFLESYNNPEYDHYFLQSAEGGYWFKATIDGVDYEFIVIKDSSKMITPTHKTSDMVTNVEISSTSTSVPLDTAIEVEKLTSGEEYERIIKILNVKENETFNLKLYSKSLENYITKLEDGTFEVRIPLPDKFKDKTDLWVYYVDEDGKVHDYEVEISKDGYAIFTTDHFSIYTLSEKRVDTNNNADKPIVDENKDNINDNTNSNENKENNDKSGSNVKTGDNIMLYVTMFVISIIGIVVTKKIKKI